MSRSYTPTDITYKIPVLQFGYILGAFPATIAASVMKNITFKICPFLIDYSNILGVLMVVAFSLIQILTVTFAHDLFLEYDLKECFLLKNKQKNIKVETADFCGPETENIKPEETVPKQINKYNFKDKNIANSLKRLFSNYDLVLIYHLVW